jgi:hypothetical protein
MPERVTKEERIVSLAIEKARKAKEELSAKKRKNIEPTQVLEIDTDPEVEKVKRPKVQDASKITNQTQKKEGYGLAGESLKKAKFQGPPRKSMGGTHQDSLVRMLVEQSLRNINRALKDAESKNDVDTLKRMIKNAQEEIDKIDEKLLDAAKYGKGSKFTDNIDRTDSKYLSLAGAKGDNTRNFE